jgi:protein-S-isoprenylcysteine O-methyltransferase Ste14
LGLNLLAVGSAVWAPTLVTWIAAGLMVLGSDLRARAEERLLTGTFGETYSTYCQRTARFVPGLY